jgi:drug/metabolite transporter (DMT)-like permease
MNRGVKFAILAAVISGFSIFINKFAVLAIDPLTFTATKNFGVGLLVVTLLIFTKKWQLFKKLKRQEVLILILIGFVGGSVPFYLFFTGLSQTPAVNAAIIQKTLVIWVAILAISFLNERLTKMQMVGIALLFLSNIFVGGFKRFNFNEGEMRILLATILWAGETILAKKVLKTVDPDLVTGVRMGLGSIILLVAAGGLQPLTITQFFWVFITAIILFSYVSMWYRALKYAPATVVSAILVISTIVTNILSAKIVASQSGLMLAGFALLLLSNKRAFPSPLSSKS